MVYSEAVKAVAEDTGLPRSFVDKTYKAYWKTVRKYIKSLPLMEDLTDEEFQQLRPNVNIPSIGKLYVTLDRYRRLKKQREMIITNSNNYAARHQNQAPA